jgi:indole-3-acetate monooxygenase
MLMTATFDTPTLAAILDRVHQMAPELATQADDGERARRLTTPVVASLRDAGLFRLYTPRELAGSELDPWELCEVVEVVSAIDASMGWCVWNGNNGFAAGLLADPAVAASIFGPADAIVGNSARAAGTAVPVTGGYRLSGRWDLVSGCDHSTSLILFGIVLDGAAPRMIAPGVPEIRAFYVPTTACAINDKWHVLGLRATGSNEVVVDDLLVDEQFTALPFGEMHIDRTLFRVPVFTTAACAGAAVCLGIGKAAIASLTSLAATKTSIGGPAPIINTAEVQAAIGESTAALHGARAALRDSLTAIVGLAERREPITLMERGRVRAAMTHAAVTAKHVTLRMFELGSSSSIYMGEALERQMRDILAASQHVMLQRLWFAVAGRTEVGLEPGLPIV